MWETILVASIVVFAAGWVVWRLWRTAGGKGGGCGCGSSCECPQTSSRGCQSAQAPETVFNIVKKGTDHVAKT